MRDVDDCPECGEPTFVFRKVCINCGHDQANEEEDELDKDLDDTSE